MMAVMRRIVAVSAALAAFISAVVISGAAGQPARGPATPSPAAHTLSRQMHRFLPTVRTALPGMPVIRRHAGRARAITPPRALAPPLTPPDQGYSCPVATLSSRCSAVPCVRFVTSGEALSPGPVGAAAAVGSTASPACPQRASQLRRIATPR